MQQAQKAISLDPHSAEAYGALAQVYQEQGRTDDAITTVQKAIDLAPEDSASIWVVKLGSYYFAKGDMTVPGCASVDGKFEGVLKAKSLIVGQSGNAHVVATK